MKKTLILSLLMTTSLFLVTALQAQKKLNKHKETSDSQIKKYQNINDTFPVIKNVKPIDSDSLKMSKTYKEAKIVPDSQVKKSIQTFASLLDSQHVHQFGLASVAELKSLHAGRQFKKYMIGLYDLQNYKQGDDIVKLIKEFPSVEVSLVNGAGKIRTAIEFVKKKDRWVATGYGATPELLILSDAQAVVGDDVFNKGELIRIPSLLITFIAVRSNAGIEFISLDDRLNLNLYKGQKLPASEVIQRLVPLAKKHNGLPT